MTDAPVYGPALIERVIAALRLDVRLYQQVSADTAASSQALRVVLLSGVANGLGLTRRLGGVGVLAGVGAALIGWLLWAAVIFLVARIFGQRRTDRSLLRALGFADAPALLLVLGIVPVLGNAVRVIVVVWLVAATARAAQAVFNISGRRAAVISIAGFVVYLIIGAVSAHLAS